MNLFTKQTHRRRKGTYGCRVGRERWGMHTYTLLYLKRITKKVLLYSTGNSAPCYVAAWMGGEFRGEWIQNVWLSLFATHLKLSQHC